MKELSLNILDIAQNSIVAEATLVTLEITQSIKNDILSIKLSDNGWGMDEEQIKSVIDPFYTTRTTRKVGLGVPLFKMAAEMAGGEFSIESKKGVGTTTAASFQYSHIDRMPLGDMNSTLTTLIRLNPDIDFLYMEKTDEGEFTLDTRELKEVLGDVSLAEQEVISWITECINEGSHL